MRISVALCTYNGARYLEHQLASIAAQTRPPDEVVACDDGSRDDTVAILRGFAASSPFRVTVVENPVNLRSTKNFEKAIGLCDGDVIATADQDDAWYPFKLERIESVMGADPGVGLVFSDADLIDGEGDRIGVRLWESVRFQRAREVAGRGGFATLLRRSAVTGAAMAFRAEHRRLFAPIPSSWVHDEWIGLVIAAHARVTPIAEPLMQYRRHDNNQVGVAGVTSIERTKGALNTARDFFDRRSHDYIELADRLRDHPDRSRLAQGKAAHFLARAALPKSRLRRIPSVLNELVRLRYSRFSGSTLAFARDLIAPE